MTSQRDDTLPAAIRISVENQLMELNTVLPGEVVEYDPDSRRASVRGTIRLLLTDGSEISRPLIRNAPVIFPEAGGYSIRFPLSEGDSVLLLFSQRGLDNWKRSHDESAPGLGPIMSENDAVVLAGFGAAGSSAPAVSDSLVLNGPGGYLALASDRVETNMDIEIVASSTPGTLPAAAEEYEGQLRHLRTATGSQLWFCRQSGASSWEWVDILSGQPTQN